MQLRSKTISKIQPHKDFVIYWGDQETSIDVDGPLAERRITCETISSVLGADDIVALEQTHSNWGFVDQDLDPEKRFVLTEGDFLITQQQGVGLIVATADCIPLIVYNPQSRALGAVHIGWKGAATGIVENFFKHDLFRENRDEIQLFIGPSALDCCYEVQEDFFQHFDDRTKQDCSFIRDGKIYYDNRLFICGIAKRLGILMRNIYTNYNICTICSVKHCSYRRDRISQRNVTMAMLR